MPGVHARAESAGEGGKGPGAGDTHDTHDTHGLHIGTYKFRLRTGYTELFVRNKLQVRALRDRA